MASESNKDAMFAQGPDLGTFPISRVVSMGRRNTQLEPTLLPDRKARNGRYLLIQDSSLRRERWPSLPHGLAQPDPRNQNAQT
jgi:hypothetical protein